MEKKKRIILPKSNRNVRAKLMKHNERSITLAKQKGTRRRETLAVRHLILYKQAHPLSTKVMTEH